MFTIFTDTDTDLTLKEANEYGYKLISMPYMINDKEVYPYEDFLEFDYHTFYESLRKGAMPKTNAISPLAYKKYFKEELEKGRDILYVHFSRAMSGTFNAMNIAIRELKEEYPERNIYTIDTKGITILSLNIVKEIGDLYKQGKSIEEILAWSDENIDHFATYFFADNLSFFRRSGRVSNFSGLMGNLIGIKPIIYMDEKGTMTNIGKERGRVNATNKLIQYVEELGLDLDKHRIIIGHTDSIDNANKIKELLINKFGDNLNIEIAVVNPTAGSHCGPDTVGICFYSKHK